MSNGYPYPISKMDSSRWSQFAAAFRDAMRLEWSSYQFYAVRGHTDESLSNVFLSRIGNGETRFLEIHEPVLIATCKALLIPCTYKAIEIFLTKGFGKT